MDSRIKTVLDPLSCNQKNYVQLSRSSVLSTRLCIPITQFHHRQHIMMTQKTLLLDSLRSNVMQELRFKFFKKKLTKEIKQNFFYFSLKLLHGSQTSLYPNVAWPARQSFHVRGHNDVICPYQGIGYQLYINTYINTVKLGK